MELVHGVHRTGSPVEYEPSLKVVPNGGSNNRRDVFHTSFDPETESAINVVTEAVEVITGKATDELAPLSNVTDPDAFDRLITNSSNEVEIRFSYEGLTVTIDSNGGLWLRRRESRR